VVTSSVHVTSLADSQWYLWVNSSHYATPFHTCKEPPATGTTSVIANCSYPHSSSPQPMCYRRWLALHLDAKREVPEIPKITENPEDLSIWTMIAYALLFSKFYCLLLLLSSFFIVSIVYWFVSYKREYRSTHAIVSPPIIPTLIVSSSYCTRPLYCP